MLSRIFTGCVISVATLMLCANAWAQFEVETARLDDIALYPQLFAPATVVSLNQPDLSAQISANIAEFPTRVGDVVSQGQVLARLDCSEYLLSQEATAAAEASAEAQLKLSKSQLERAQSLIDNNLVSVQEIDSRQTDFDAASANLRSSKARHELAQLNVSRCEIKAPFDAIVLSRMVGVGQLVVLGTPILQVLDLNSIEVSAQVFAEDASRLENATFIEFSSSQQRYTVELQMLVSAIDSQNRNREARLNFVDSQALPGSAGQIHWTDSRPHLPAAYLLQRNGQLGFFIAEGDFARFVGIENAQSGRSNPVALGPDARVIVEGYAGLQDGDRISAIEVE